MALHGASAFDMLSDAATGLDLSIIQIIAQQVSKALAFLHGHGWIHGDVKPENILTDRTGSQLRVTLADFGECQRSGKKLGHSNGTFYYQAPEIVFGIDTSTAVDIWAFGCTLLELYTAEIALDPDSPEADYHHLADCMYVWL